MVVFKSRSYVEKLLREEVPPLLTGHSMQPKLPLVRIRVEYRDERHQVNFELVKLNNIHRNISTTLGFQEF